MVFSGEYYTHELADGSKIYIYMVLLESYLNKYTT